MDNRTRNGSQHIDYSSHSIPAPQRREKILLPPKFSLMTVKPKLRKDRNSNPLIASQSYTATAFKRERDRFKRTKMNRERALVFLFCLFLGWCFSLLLVTLPLEGRILTSIPINPIVFLTVTCSMVMLSKLCTTSSCPTKTRYLILSTILLCTIIIFFITRDTAQGTRFDPNVLRVLTILVCTIAAFPFLAGTQIIKFSNGNAERDSIFFATSAMWLSPFLSEVFIWAKWYTEGAWEARVISMTLGGAGTKDVLFFFGFWALASLTFFHLLLKLFKRLKQKTA